MKKYTLFILLTAFSLPKWVVAQQVFKPDTAKIALLPRTANDSITLRWLVDKFDVLKMGLESGYEIKRAELNGGSWSKFNTVATVKAWSKSQWNNHINSIKDTSSYAYKYAKMAYDIVVEKSSTSADLSSLEGMQMAKAENDLKFLFATLASCNDRYAAEGMALRWVDKQVQSGKKYRYRIDLVLNTGKIPVLGVEADAQAVPHVSKAKAKIEPIENENNITLNWEIAEEPLISYSLERSDDNGRTFRRLNNEPILMSEKTDSNQISIGTLADTMVQLYKPYIYRVIGNTLFADETLVGQVKAMARDRTPVSSIFVPNPEPISHKVARIKWQLTAPAPDLVGFRIRRDAQREGKFDKILNKNLLSPKVEAFDDATFDPSVSNYYIVETVDTAGNIFRSQPVYLLVVDSIPPAAPNWVKATIDSNGIVTLHLKLNKETDFMGYRILKANQEDHEFSTIIESYTRNDSLFLTGRDSIFYDTVSLNTLTSHVFYKAVALDFHYNESGASKPISVTRPDTIPPVTPLLTAIDVSDTALVLQITPSSSEDVKETKVLRKRQNEDNWTIYQTLKPTETSFIDKNVETNVVYEYALQAIDSNNLSSPISFSLTGRPYDLGVREGINNFEANYDKDSKEVVLTWLYKPTKERNEKVFFLIYRSIGNGSLERYSTVPNEGQFIFKDSEFSNKGKYNYSIKVVTDTGAESELSAKMVTIIE